MSKGKRNCITEIYPDKKTILLGPSGTSAPTYRWEFQILANRYLFCKKEDFIKVGLKDEAKILIW